MAETLEVEARVKNHNCNLKFKQGAKELFYPFSARIHQHIVTETLRHEIDFRMMRKHGVIVDHFPVHTHERESIIQSWSEYRMRLQIGFLTSRFKDNMQPLNVIKNYYGEKKAFFFAWLMHYTGWLIPLSIFGIVYTLSFISIGADQNVAYDQMLNTPESFIYGTVVVVWVTLFNESWKRK